MRERDFFVLAKETHLVHAGDSATAQRVHADLLGVARSAHALAAIDGVVACLGLGFDDGIEQQFGSAAGGIDLLVMVRLDDFAVKAGQLACGLCYQMTQGCDTDGVIAGVHDAGVLTQLAQAIHLLGCVACSARDQRRARALDIGDDSIEGRNVREVDDDVGCWGVLELGQVEADLGDDVKNGLSSGVDNALGGSADERAHAARSHNDGLNQADQLPSKHR